MSDMISMPKQEWAKLEERARTLARDKSYLQLVNNLMNSLSQVPGLEHTAEAILHSILENLGGTNVALYYPIESRIHYATVYGERKVLDSVDDAMVRAAFERREFVEEVRDFTNTEMMTPVFTKASYWAMPLMVGEQLVGVLKTEGMLMTTAEIRSHLLPFFNYAALILKNEIESYLRFAEAARLAAIVQSTDDAIIGKTLEGAITSWNTGAEKIYGYTASEVVGRSIALLVPPGREDELPQILAQIKEGQHVEHYETMRRRKDGWDIHVSLTVSPIKDGTGCIVGASTIARNITARKRAEEELHRVNRALRMLSDSNQTLIRTTDETGLLNEICRIVVEVGGYRMAWVGFAEYDEAKTVRPVAHAGFESGYLESANLTWADCERGRSPGGIAIRTGQPCIVRSILDDPAFVPWREEAVRRGYQSIIALPLTSEGQTFGALGIYAAEAEVFDAKEVEILKELAGDLTFGIVALRTRAERKQAGEALQSAAVKYRIVADNTYDWEFWLSPADEFIYISPSCKRITGYEADEFRADPGLLGRIVHQDDRPRLAGHRHDMTQRMKPGELEYRIVHADGTIRWIDHVCQPVFDEEGNFLGTRGSNRDITERKRAEAELRRVNRALRAISECNQVLVRASDEAELLHAICQTIVQEGGYRMAWVGFAEQDKKKTLRPVALAGYEEGYIEKGNFTWSDTEEGRGVGGTAIRTGRPAVCQNLLTDSNFARWRDEALKHGYAACLGLPLLSEGKAFGTLAIYSSEPDAFDATEVKLLSEQAEDLAYGIVALRTRAERKLAEEALQDSEQKLKTIVHGSPIPQFVIDRDHRVIYWNKALEEISGIRAEEVTGTSRHWRAFYHAERPCLADLLVDGAVEAIPDWYVGKCNKSKYAADAYEATDYFPMLGEKGKWLYFSAATILDAKGNVIGAVETLEDVTERKRAEEALRESRRTLFTLMSNLPGMAYRCCNDRNWTMEFVSQGALALTGYTADELMQSTRISYAQVIHPDDRDAVWDAVQAALQARQSFQMVYRIVTATGVENWVWEKGQGVFSEQGELLALEGFITDITERKQAEEALRRLNRELRAISNCNQVLVRAEDEQTLLNDICRIVCDEAGYRMAWVGYAEHDDAKTVRPVAWGGFDNGYVANAKLSWAEDAERAQGPGGAAIRSGETVCVQDFITDPRMAPWRESALQRGYRSTIALPLKDESANVFGVLLIYSSELNAFTPEEIRLLEELAGDLAFGIIVLRGRIVRQRVEEALRLASAYNRNLIEVSLDPLVTIGPNGKITDVNAATEKVTGCSRTELIGTDFSNYFTEPEKARAGYQQVFREGFVKDYALELRHRDGRLTSVLYNASVYRDNSGKVIGVFAAARDITERRRAEEALRDSEESFRSLAEQSPLSIQVLSPDGRTLQINHAFETLWGITLKDLENYNLLADQQLVRLGLMPCIQRAFSGEATAIPPAEYSAKDALGTGNKKWVQARIYPVKDDAGNVRQVVLIHEDITERKRAETALRQSEQRKTILNQIAHIFLTVPDEEIYAQVLSVVLQAMKSKFGIFGYIGTNGDLVVPSLTGEVWSECKVTGKSVIFSKATWGNSLWGRAIRESKTYCSDGPFHTPKGHINIDHFLAVPIVFGNTSIGLLSVANAERSYTKDDKELLENIADSISPILNAKMQRDLQEQKRQQAEEEIRKLNADLEQRVAERTAQLQEANKELEAFSYSVSHDLRAPLRAIAGYANIVVEDYAKQLDEEGRRELGVISQETKRMGQLIDDLLAFSRMSRQSAQWAEVDMGDLAQEVYNECEARASGRKLQFKLHPLPPARGDRALLRHVLVNLISNAIKYSRPRAVAEIEMGGCEEGGELLYYVKDNGVGFDMKYVQKLFGVFQRLHTEEQFEGTGVGLAIVQRVIHRHGGRVWAESTLNEGATFHFSLPVRKEPPVQGG